MQIRTITNFLLDKFPLRDAELYDNSGFSVKFNLSEKLEGIILAIDVTSKVLEEAIANKANLIIVHHPFKFYETWEEEFSKTPYKKEILKKLKQHRINVLALHTNYDNAYEGTSYQIAKQLGYEKFKQPYKLNYPCIIEFSEIKNINEIINNFKNKLHFWTNRWHYNWSLKKSFNLKKLAILSGSGPLELIIDMNINKDIDLFITSDIKWNEWLAYKEHNIKVMEIPHLDEEVFAYHIYEILKTHFANNYLNIKVVATPLPYDYA